MKIPFEIRGKSYGVNVSGETPGWGSGPVVELLIDGENGFFESSRFYFNAGGLSDLIEVLEQAKVALEDRAS